jgi:hypothetical protein
VTVSNPGALSLAWADDGTALLGVDATRHVGLQPVDGGAFRALAALPVRDTLVGVSPSPARSSDGQTVYLVGLRDVAGRRHGVVMAIRLADLQRREVLRFDEPARPHSTASNGIAEYDGWLYFTLSDFQSDVWVARVEGLKE